MSNRPLKIAVVRYRFIGDTLLAIPFLRALRTMEPEAEIDLLVGEDAYDLMRYCPYINRAIRFEPRKSGFWHAVGQIRQGGYDRAYLLKRSLSSALMVWLAGIPQRIGFNTEHRGMLLTRQVDYRPEDYHEAVCFLQLLDLPDGFSPNLSLETWLPDSAEEKADALLKPANGPRVVLHATSTNAAKCWPVPHFQALAEALVNQYGAQLYFLGATADMPTYEALSRILSPQTREATVNLCGQTTVAESMALLKRMDLVVANDSGMVHMAAASQTPVVVLFGPMDPKQWRPLSSKATVLTHPDLTCRPCRMKITCNHRYPCLSEITPQMVYEACKAYLTS